MNTIQVRVIGDADRSFCSFCVSVDDRDVAMFKDSNYADLFAEALETYLEGKEETNDGP